MKQLVIFDLDGTLIDSLADIADAANKTLKSNSLPEHPIDSYRYFVGNGLRNLVRRIAPQETSEPVLQKLSDGFKNIYDQGWNHRTVAYPGIIEMLHALDKNGVGMAILSNKPHSFTTVCAKEFFPGIPFTRVYGQRDNFALKPDPGSALKIAEECGCPAPYCMFVGDTSIDIQTGKKAAMTAVGVTWGFRDRAELEQAGADIIINNPEELITYACRPI